MGLVQKYKIYRRRGSREENIISTITLSDKDLSYITLEVEEFKMICRNVANVHLNFFDYIKAKY